MTKKTDVMHLKTASQEGQELAIYTGDDMRLVNSLLEDKLADNVFSVYRNKQRANTLKRQRDDLVSFSKYLELAGLFRSPDELLSNPQSWQGIGKGLIEGFQLWLENSGYAMGTVNIRLVTIRNYCRLLALAGLLPEEELAMILAVKGKSQKEGRNIDEHRASQGTKTRKGYKKEAPVTLRTSQVFALKRASQPVRRKASNRNHDKLLAARDSVLMGLIFEHALRCGEVVSLDIECFDMDSGQFTFYREKTARSLQERETHTLKKHTRNALEDYLALVTQLEGRTAGPLFTGYQGHRIGARAINARVAVLGQEQGIEGNLSPHDARHFWAYDAFKNGTSLDKVVSGGGWRSSEMALRYAKRAGIANEGVKISEE